MKKCPRCGEIYYDDNQNYCLNDGATLIFAQESQSTIVIDPKTLPKTISNPAAPSPEKPGVSPIFAYTTIGLLALIVGGVAALILTNYFSAKPETASAPSNSPLNQNQMFGSNNQPNQATNSNSTPEPNKTPAATPAPTAAKTPAPPPVPKGERYGGTIGDENAVFNVVWPKLTGPVSGSYYLSSSPGTVYALSGNNPATGRATINVSTGGTHVGQMQLNKNNVGNNICWEGYLSAGNKSVKFCRRG